MRIKELNLQSFGKFVEKKIQLQRGLNIIYGENESGKSTVFKFIEAMFYGFAKNGKQRKYTDDFEKYRPWNGSEYKGSLVFENGDEYRIMRDFARDEIDFYNMSSGENLSDVEGLYAYAKIKQPGAFLFKIDSEVFKNTFFIGQLGSEISSDVENLKYAIENFATTGYEDYSVVDAISILDKKIDELGRASRKNSPIGSVTQSLSQLNELKDNLKLQLGDYEEKQAEFLDLKRSLDEQKNFVKKLQLSKEQEDYEKAKKIMVNSAEENGISDNDLEYLESFLSEYDSVYDEIELNAQFEEVSEEKTELEADYEQFLTHYQKLLELNSINYSKERELLNKDLIITKSEVGSLKIKIILAGLIGVLSLLIGIKTKMYVLLIVVIACIIYIFIKISPFRMKLEVIKRLENRIWDYIQKSEEKAENKRALEVVFAAFITKYNESDIEKLKLKLDSKVELYKKKKMEDNIKIQLEKEKFENLQKRLAELEETRKEIESKYGLSLDEIRAKYLSNTAKQKRASIEGNKMLLEHILNGRDLNSLNHGVEIIDADMNEEQKALEMLEQRYFEISKDYILKDEILKKIIELEEDIDNYNTKLDELKAKKNALERAKEVLVKIYLQNKTVYLPKIVEFMAQFIGEITDGKYTNLTVNEKFEITVVDEKTGKLVSAKNLSNGTIDQLYLGLRLAISELLYENVPVILDDHFVQYDDTRLKEALLYLKKYSEKKQVIIFSAMKREFEICEREGIEYDKVIL